MAKSEGLFDRGRRTLGLLSNAGLLDPRFLFASGRSVLRHGATIALGISASAWRRPNDLGLVDDRGELTFGELGSRVFSLANGLRQAGVGPGRNVGILCRNHRGFVEATAAVSQLGADALFLNTGFAGPQLGEVLDREGAASIVYDEEFEAIVDAHAGKRERFLAWHDSANTVPTLDELIGAHPDTDPGKPDEPGGATSH